MYGAYGEKLGVYTFARMVYPTGDQAYPFQTVGYTNVNFAGRVVRSGGAVPQVDRLGTDRSGGARYRPYGQEITQTGDDRVKFATYTRDSFTGLDYADQRFYASSYGRFNTADPYEASAKGTNDPSAPTSWNRYAYVTGDPINLLDPGGTCGTPSQSYTTADGTIGISVSIPCSAYPDGFTLPFNWDFGQWQRQPPKYVTKDSDDDYRGAQAKCPSVASAPPGLDATQIQKNVDSAQLAFNNAVAMADPEGTGAGVYSFFGFLTAQFAPRGAWDYKNDPQYGASARDFGNFNFGAVLASTGATYYQTQNAAGVAQIVICIFGGACGTGVPGFVFPYGDQVVDAAQIKKGWTYENTVMSGCRP